MKSSFLLAFVILLGASMARVEAQTPAANKAAIQMENKKQPARKVVKPAPKAAATTVENPATRVLEKSSFDKFADRLRIGYFGVVTTPNFYDMAHGNWDTAAMSPAWGGPNNRDTWPTNVWNQISFNYNFGAKLNFVFNPRFMIPLGSTRNMNVPEDPSFIMLDDFLVGFQGVIVSSVDKKFNLWVRPGIRLPTSQNSRNNPNRGFGTHTHQIEVAYLPTYDFNKTWQLGIFGQFRQWIFEQRYNWSRFRFYTAPFVQMTLNDTTRLQVYYENIIENDRRWKSINGKEPVFKDYWQNIMLGVNKDITSKLNIFPYVSVFVDDVPISSKSFWLGAWISYQIK